VTGVVNFSMIEAGSIWVDENTRRCSTGFWGSIWGDRQRDAGLPSRLSILIEIPQIRGPGRPMAPLPRDRYPEPSTHREPRVPSS
jgi:hypothetical protein